MGRGESIGLRLPALVADNCCYVNPPRWAAGDFWGWIYRQALRRDRRLRRPESAAHPRRAGVGPPYKIYRKHPVGAGLCARPHWLRIIVVT